MSQPDVNIHEADPDDAAAIADIQIASYRTAYAAWMPADYLARYMLEEETQDRLNLMTDSDRGDVLLVAERHGATTAITRRFIAHAHYRNYRM
jgi:hypothetical protein